jgi:acetoacetate decarboxylase
MRISALLPQRRHGEGRVDRPAAIELFGHALCDVARLPVREVVSASHYLTDLTLGLGEVVFDYLKTA